MGEKYNSLTMVGEPYKKERNKSLQLHAVFRCDCGNEKECLLTRVKMGKIKSCGCRSQTDLSKGDTIKNWTLISEPYSLKSRRHGDFQCRCGTVKTIPLYIMKSGKCSDCGCLKHNKSQINRINFNDVKIGTEFEKLTVISRPFKKFYNGKNHYFFVCQCECGSIKDYLWYRLKSINKSCGCVKRQKAANRMVEYNTKYEDTGTLNTKLYSTWKSMNNRCISWQDFTVFKQWAENNGYQENMCLSRKNYKLEYSPNNCYYATLQTIFNNPEIKNKRHNTMIQRYGKESFLSDPNIRKKVEETCIRKYGVKHAICDKGIRDKIRQSVQNKYGVDSCLQLPEVKAKIRQTCIEKYGVPVCSQNPEIMQKTIDTCIEKYGRFPVMCNGKSKPELAIQQWLSELGFDFQSTYKLISPKQIDLYNEEIGIAIEYCGTYWHNEKSPQPRDRKYHYDKYKSCLDKNVRLFTIFSDEWASRELQWKNLLKSVLGIYEQRVYARKCTIQEVDYKTGKQFFEDYHIQGGKRKALIYFGIYYQSELLGVVSLNRHHRNVAGKIVLDRLCFKDGVQIVGGASKLLTRCIEWSKNNEYQEMVSWSDNRYSQGDVYEKLGFQLESHLPPDYSYVDIINTEDKRYSKQSMKTIEKDKVAINNYGKIWDCGKKRYVLKLN